MTRLLVVDTETSGLDPSRHSTLELAAVVWDDGRLAETFHVRIWEHAMTVDPESMAINRIDLERLRIEGISPQRAVARFEDFLVANFASANGQRIGLAGHNLMFDVPFLKALYGKAGLDYGGRFSHRTVDTAGVLAVLILAGRLPASAGGSSAAFEHFGVAPPKSRRHTALGDAVATAQLLTKLVESLREPQRNVVAAVG